MGFTPAVTKERKRLQLYVVVDQVEVFHAEPQKHRHRRPQDTCSLVNDHRAQRAFFHGSNNALREVDRTDKHARLSVDAKAGEILEPFSSDVHVRFPDRQKFPLHMRCARLLGSRFAPGCRSSGMYSNPLEVRFRKREPPIWDEPSSVRCFRLLFVIFIICLSSLS